eukprot:scaffold16887_cov145-Skeletonema_menzelii.AAC.1
MKAWYLSIYIEVPTYSLQDKYIRSRQLAANKYSYVGRYLRTEALIFSRVSRVAGAVCARAAGRDLDLPY